METQTKKNIMILLDVLKVCYLISDKMQKPLSFLHLGYKTIKILILTRIFQLKILDQNLLTI